MGWFGRFECTENDDGFIVKVGCACLKVGDGLKDCVDCGLGGGVVLGFEELLEAVVAEHVAGGVDGVDDAVGEEDDEVAGAGGESELFVFGVGKEAERETFGLNRAHGGGLASVRGVGGDEERLDGAGVGDLEGLVAVVPDGHEHGDVLRVEFALLELVVERREHLSR